MQARTAEIQTHVFTDYIRLLNAKEEPTPELIEEVVLALWRALRSELKKRGLWQSSPTYLGVYGLTSWDQATVGAGRGLGEGCELVADCFRYIFINRFRFLTRQLAIKPNIDGLIFRNIRNFLHDTQKKHDPLGFRVFSLVRTAVLQMVENKELEVVQGDPKIRNSTVLRYSSNLGLAHHGVLLEPIVKAWSNTLLPDLITARGRHQEDVVAELRRLLLELPLEGVQGFRFSHLLEPVKNDIRARWSALFDVSEGESGLIEDDTILHVVRRIGSQTRFEDREAFSKLAVCVEKTLENVAESPTVKQYLFKLWQALKIHAADPEEQQGYETSILTNARLPSHRKLAEMLDIPRNRVSKLFAILGQLVGNCRQGVAEPSTATAKAFAGDRSTLENLRAGVVEARRQASSLWMQGRSSPEEGDLYLLDRTAELGLEWLILEQANTLNRVWAVPVDTNPLSGSADIAVPREAPQGPLTLRCGYGVWLSDNELEPRLRTGHLDAHTVRRARTQWQRLQAGSLIGSTLEQEVDADPEYTHWVDEVLKPAQDRLVRRVSRRTWTHGISAVAASVLLAVALGLSGGLIWQHQRLTSVERERTELAERLSQLEKERQVSQELQAGRLPESPEPVEQIPASQQAPSEGTGVQINPPTVVFQAEDTFRSFSRKVEVTPSDAVIHLQIVVENPAVSYRLEIVRSETGSRIWRGESLKPNRWSELVLSVPISLVPPGEYRLRLDSFADHEVERVGDYGLILVATDRGPDSDP